MATALELVSEHQYKAMGGFSAGDFMLLERHDRIVPDGSTTASSHGAPNLATEQQHPHSTDGLEKQTSSSQRNGEPSYTPKLYLIESITFNGSGGVVNVGLRELQHCLYGSNSYFNAYRLYGTLAPKLAIHLRQPNQHMTNLADKVDKGYHWLAKINPDSDVVRKALYGPNCPANCVQGFLQDQEEQARLLPDPLPRTQENYRPFCPICMGIDMAVGYLELHKMYDVSGVPIDELSHLCTRLNARRAELGYGTVEFDIGRWELPNREELQEWEELQSQALSSRPKQILLTSKVTPRFVCHFGPPPILEGTRKQLRDLLAEAEIGTFVLLECFPLSDAPVVVVNGQQHSNGDEDSVVERDPRVQPGYSTAVFVVDQLSLDETGNLLDLQLRKLRYCLRVSEATDYSYHVYGEEIRLREDLHSISGDRRRVLRITDETHTDIASLAERVNGTNWRLTPFDEHMHSADIVHATVFGFVCPAECNKGVLEGGEEELDSLYEYDVSYRPTPRPLCPVCIGRDLMYEYLDLRLLHDTSTVPFADIQKFYDDLHERFAKLGYQPYDFDEHNWGPLFPDVFEQWDEAYDPNAYPIFLPASETAIAALRRKPYAELEKDVTACIICSADLSSETTVVELPCGHFYCECIDEWLRSSNSCPECRAQLPEESEEMEEDAGEDDEDEEHEEYYAEEIDEDGSAVDEEVDVDTAGLLGNLCLDSWSGLIPATIVILAAGISRSRQVSVWSALS